MHCSFHPPIDESPYISCKDDVTQIWFPNLYRMRISTRVTTWGPVIRSLFVWPTGRRHFPLPMPWLISSHEQSSQYAYSGSIRGWGRGILYYALLRTDSRSLTKGFQFNALCNESRDVHKWWILRIWKDTTFLYGKRLNQHWRGDMPAKKYQKNPSNIIRNEKYHAFFHNVSNYSYEMLPP
jgi:hypothetical protein